VPDDGVTGALILFLRLTGQGRRCSRLLLLLHLHLLVWRFNERSVTVTVGRSTTSAFVIPGYPFRRRAGARLG
jgi:hypothetical protein